MANITASDTPEAEFMPGQSIYLTAFLRLMHDRQFVGMTGVPMPLPYTALSQYARDIELPADEMPMFLRMVGALDEEWRAHVAAKQSPPKKP